MSSSNKESVAAAIQVYLFKFRRLSSVTSLHRLVGRLESELEGEAKQAMLAAAKHRKAEIALGQLFDQGSLTDPLLQYLT